MWGSIGWAWGSSAANTGYLIPESGNVVSHVSATDLNAGTAKKGPVWTNNGPVVYNPNDKPRPSVGPYSDVPLISFSLAPSNVLNFGNGSFTIALVAIVRNFDAISPVFISTGNYATQGFFIQAYSSQINFNVNTSPFTQASFPITVPLNTPLIILGGIDASTNTAYISVNGAAPVTATLGSAMTSSSQTTYLGTDTASNSNSLDGGIQEFYASTDRPSPAAFAALYAAIIANEQTYLIPDDSATVVHVNALDLYSGTSKKGPVWTKSGTNVYSPTALPSVSQFSGGAYSLPASNPLNFAASFSGVALYAPTQGDRLSGNAPISDGYYNGGYSAGWAVQSDYGFRTYGTASADTANSQDVNPYFHVVQFGWNSVTNTIYTQVDGNAPTTATGNYAANTVLQAFIGDISGQLFQGPIYELMVGTTVPSGTVFTNRLNAIIAASRRSYLIADTNNTVGHWNATDLALGLSKVGPAWVQNGIIPYQADGLRPSVGPFSSSNYFSQPSSPLAFQSSPWAVTLVLNNVTIGTACDVFGKSGGGSGPLLQLLANGTLQYTSLGVASYPATTDALTPGFNVISVGYDTSGDIVIKINSDTATVIGAVSYSPPAVSSTINLGYQFSSGLSGSVIEVTATHDAPSDAAFTAIYNQVTSHYQPYLIPVSTNSVGHANAADLNAGTSKTGPVFTKNGTVPYSACLNPRPSVGPFTDSIYLSQVSTSAYNIASEPYTMVLLCNPTSVSDNPISFASGSYAAQGSSIQLTSSGGVQAIQGNTVLATSNTVPGNGLTVLIWGQDASGKLFTQANGGTVATVSCPTIASSSTGVFLGRGVATGNSFVGTIYEVRCSTDVPSVAAFNALYQAIQRNLS